MTLIETAKTSGLDPQAHLADLLERIHDHAARRLDDLPPRNWTPAITQNRAAQARAPIGRSARTRGSRRTPRPARNP